MNRFLTACALMGLSAAISCSSNKSTEPSGSDPATETYAAALGVDIPTMIKVSRDLYFSDITVGSGATIADSTVISVIYTGWLVNGTQVQTNVGKAAFQMKVGHGDNLKGWDLGIVGMKVGGTRLLAIGSALAYGTEGGGCTIGNGAPRCLVPTNSTVVYKIQVISSP